MRHAVHGLRRPLRDRVPDQRGRPPVTLDQGVLGGVVEPVGHRRAGARVEAGLTVVPLQHLLERLHRLDHGPVGELPLGLRDAENAVRGGGVRQRQQGRGRFDRDLAGDRDELKLRSEQVHDCLDPLPQRPGGGIAAVPLALLGPVAFLLESFIVQEFSDLPRRNNAGDASIPGA